MSGSTTRSFTYAYSGQLSQDVRGGSSAYVFTSNNNGRVASASLNGTTIATYVYNGIEQRVAKTASGATTHDVYDRFGHLLSEDNSSGTPIREYIWLGDLPIALIDDTGMNTVIYYIHTDQVGRPQKMTDGSASVVWDAIYDPFGNVSSGSGSTTNLLMFPGQVYDSETGLAQNWNRDYDPTLGRYIQSDPIGLRAGINTYGYVGQNPVLRKDRRGLSYIASGGGTNIGSALQVVCRDPTDSDAPDQPNDTVTDESGGGSNQSESESGDSGGGSTSQSNSGPSQSDSPSDNGTAGLLQQAGFDQGAHHYDFSIPLCVGCSPEQAFDAVRSFSAPGAPYAQNGTHTVTLTGNNPITQTVDPNNLTITNTTLPGHVFDPGSVQLSVVQDPSGAVMEHVVGNGTGSYSTVNQVFGPTVFFALGLEAFYSLNPITVGP